MRLGALVPVCLLAASLHAAAAVSSNSTGTTTPPPPSLKLPPPPVNVLRQHRLRPQGMTLGLDSRVLAALFASSAGSDFDINVRPGEPGLCDADTCSVPVTIKLPETAGPATLALAVANSKGEISGVAHAECTISPCTLRLVLERGRNTLAVGAGDASSQTAGISLVTIDASPVTSVSAKGKTEWF